MSFTHSAFQSTSRTIWPFPAAGQFPTETVSLFTYDLNSAKISSSSLSCVATSTALPHCHSDGSAAVASGAVIATAGRLFLACCYPLTPSASLPSTVLSLTRTSRSLRSSPWSLSGSFVRCLWTPSSLSCAVIGCSSLSRSSLVNAFFVLYHHIAYLIRFGRRFCSKLCWRFAQTPHPVLVSEKCSVLDCTQAPMMNNCACWAFKLYSFSNLSSKLFHH